MNGDLQVNRLSFRIHFIRVNGPESDPTVRLLLVETSKAETIYWGSGTWSDCRRWIIQLSKCAIFGDRLAAVEKRLELNRLATIEAIEISVCDLESVGFSRADC